MDSIDSVESEDSTDSIDSIDSIESEDSTDSLDSIDFIDSIESVKPIESIESVESVESILVPHKRPPTFTPHTKGARASRAPTTVPMGRALRARPIGTVVFPFVCGVNVGGTCVC